MSKHGSFSKILKELPYWRHMFCFWFYFFLLFFLQASDEENSRCWHLPLAGQAPWFPQPLCQWWSCGTEPHTAAGSTLHVLLAVVATQDGHWWSNHRKVWGFQNASAAKRNSWSLLTRSKQEFFFFSSANTKIVLPRTVSLKAKRDFKIIRAFLWPRKLQFQINVGPCEFCQICDKRLGLFKWQWKSVLYFNDIFSNTGVARRMAMLIGPPLWFILKYLYWMDC